MRRHEPLDACVARAYPAPTGRAPAGVRRTSLARAIDDAIGVTRITRTRHVDPTTLGQTARGRR